MSPTPIPPTPSGEPRPATPAEIAASPAPSSAPLATATLPAIRWWQSKEVWTGIMLVAVPALSIALTLLGDGTPFTRQDWILVVVAAGGGFVMWARLTSHRFIVAKDLMDELKG